MTFFTDRTLKFLRALKRNNDRDWFKARKAIYERDVRQPMLALIAQLAVDFRKVAPDFVAEPKVSMYRIYRDTRFSSDKSPLKTHVAAHFPVRGVPKGQGGGLYVEIAPGWVWMGGGLYMPASEELRAIRTRIAETHPRFHRTVTAAPFRRHFGALGGETISRVPRGFASDHPAAAYLRYKQFLAGRELEARFATSPRFYGDLLATFKAAAPLVRFLTAAMATADAAATTTEPSVTKPTTPLAPRPAPMW